MPRRLAALFTLVVALFAGAGTPALGASPSATPISGSSEGADTGAGASSDSAVTWGIVPANADGEPDGRISFRLTLDPGASVTDYALVTNHSSREVTFDLVASDGQIAEDGAFDILTSQETPTDAGLWISVADSVTVPAGQSALVPFTIVVPDNATPGDHPAGLTAGLGRQSADGSNAQLGVDMRVGVRLHLRVSGDIAPAVAITDAQWRYEPSWNPFAPGTLRVTYTVANEGNVRLGTTESVRIDPLIGGVRDTVVSTDREVLPGGITRVEASVAGIWPLLRLSANLTSSPAAIGSDDLAGALPVMVSTDTTLWTIPYSQLALIVVLALAVVLALRYRRHRRDKLARALAAARAEGAASARAGDAEAAPATGTRFASTETTSGTRASASAADGAPPAATDPSGGPTDRPVEDLQPAADPSA